MLDGNRDCSSTCSCLAPELNSGLQNFVRHQVAPSERGCANLAAIDADELKQVTSDRIERDRRSSELRIERTMWLINISCSAKVLVRLYKRACSMAMATWRVTASTISNSVVGPDAEATH